jgi:uncharacterized protein YxeA
MKAKLTTFIILISFVTNAQFILKGIVLDENNEPIPYVNILVKNTTTGTTTDDYGNFFITIKRTTARIEVSFLGYETVVKRVSKKNKFLRIKLKEEADQLDEILIISRPKKRLKKKRKPCL